MYMVYWISADADGSSPQAKAFDSSELSAALAFMEALRARQRSDEGVGFVTMCSENPDSVGHPGAADPSPDYAWKKRRP